MVLKITVSKIKIAQITHPSNIDLSQFVSGILILCGKKALAPKSEMKMKKTHTQKQEQKN